ncbi:uncharacterized protein LOC121375915 isoform X2 [Gigantopelta aegis]|uniref:uncharacterized protein LOC121375915 isoform X2 n=1 Tax=Gigantopelta aegis TaxID=1735272 RepID=UPI001B889C93|nr:uncharacterized protein LOC121375915 isoform X2 [Gigantopelta aegis]
MDSFNSRGFKTRSDSRLDRVRFTNPLMNIRVPLTLHGKYTKVRIPTKLEILEDSTEPEEVALITPLKESNVRNIFIQGAVHRWIGCKANKTPESPYVLPQHEGPVLVGNRSDNSADPLLASSDETEFIDTVVLQDDIGKMKHDDGAFLRRFVKGVTKSLRRRIQEY